MDERYPIRMPELNEVISQALPDRGTGELVYTVEEEIWEQREVAGTSITTSVLKFSAGTRLTKMQAQEAGLLPPDPETETREAQQPFPRVQLVQNTAVDGPAQNQAVTEPEETRAIKPPMQRPNTKSGKWK